MTGIRIILFIYRLGWPYRPHMDYQVATWKSLASQEAGVDTADIDRLSKPDLDTIYRVRNERTASWPKLQYSSGTSYRRL